MKTYIIQITKKIIGELIGVYFAVKNTMWWTEELEQLLRNTKKKKKLSYINKMH